MYRWLEHMVHSLKTSLRRKISHFRLPRYLQFDFYWRLLTSPFRASISVWQSGRVRNLVLGIPSVLVFSVFVFWLGRGPATGISSNYWESAKLAISNKEYEKAELLLDRILRARRGHEGDARFALALMFDEMGMKERAASLFNVLAPDNAQGYPEAHRRLAIMLSVGISTQSSKEDRDRLHSHLERGQIDSTPGMALAWGRYSIAVRDLEAARRYLRVAVSEYPVAWKRLSDVEVALGNRDAAISGYERATDHLANELRLAPGNHAARVDYVDVLIRLGRVDEATTVLEEGQRIAPEEDATWRQLLAAVYVNYHDLMSLTGKNSVGDLLQPLAKSLKYDPNFVPALNRLMSYANAKTDGNIELREVLNLTVAEGKNPALAHLALGNLCWMEGLNDQAFFHFERARKIDGTLTVVMNNLAWILAHDEKNPNFEQALALVNEALKGSPDNLPFLDTRGTIFYLQEDWESAIDDLEKALEGVRDKKAVHEKLARIYEELDLPDIARQHRLLANGTP